MKFDFRSVSFKKKLRVIFCNLIIGCPQKNRDLLKNCHKSAKAKQVSYIPRKRSMAYDQGSRP